MVAQIIPVGLLIIGFEIRIVPKMVATGRAGSVLIWTQGISLVLALPFGIVAEWLLLVSVTTGTPLGGFSTVVVWTALWLIGQGSFILLLGSLANYLGLLERVGSRARARVERSARRSARRDAYIRRHHLPRSLDDG